MLNKVIAYFFFKRWLALFFLCQAFSLASQAPYYYSINEEKGLPSSEVYQVIQDDFGYIWIGCDAGLYRYDGIRFKSFTTQKQNSKSISGLKIDEDKTLWCQNFSGQIFKVSGDSLSLVIDVSKKIASYSQYTIDTKRRIWIASDKHIELFDLNGKLLGSISKIGNTGDTVIWQEIEVNRRGQVYAGSQNNGIALIKDKGKHFDVEFLDNSTTSNQRMAFEQFNQGLLVLKETNIERQYFISLITEKGEQSKTNFLPFTKDGLVYKIYNDNLNRHWLCTSSGIVKLNENFDVEREAGFLFKDDKISGVFQDREGNLWVSSLQNGIYVIPDYDLVIYDEQSSPLTDHNITALLTTSANELLIGTYTGQVFILRANNALELVPKSVRPAYRTVKKMTEKDGGVYVAHGPLSFYNKQKEALFAAYNFRDFGWLGDTLFFVTSGIFGYLPSFYQIPSTELGKRSIALHKRGCRALAIDDKGGTIYFASIDGLYRYARGKVEEIKVQGKTIFAAKLAYENGMLWIGTVNDGMLVLKDGKLLYHYNDGQLLKGSSVKCFKLFKDDLYVATNEGLSVINYKKQSSHTYNYTDGIVSKEINAIECYNGSVYLATNRGLLKLPHHLPINSIKPFIEINAFLVNHRKVELKNVVYGIGYRDNNIIIQFNTACLRARGNFIYKYRLLGLDTAWTTNAAINNQVQYSSLPYGDFRFEVKAVNEDGTESVSKGISFYIDPPFWQRWWFYAVMVLFGSGIVAVLFMIRIRFIKRRAELKNKVIASQLTALKSQMNPHFLFNTLNSLQDLILKHDIRNSNFYLNKFSVLMREVLDISGKEEISLGREVQLLETYLELEKLRFGNEFSFKVSADENLDTDHLMLPPMIIQPFIENALKHGLLHKRGNKELLIDFKLFEGNLICEVTDNGVGRKRSAEIKARMERTHQSFSTEATEKRIELLNSFNNKKYDFKIYDLGSDEKPEGTKVVIVIPI